MPTEHSNIIERAINGDRKAFGNLVQKYQQYAFNLAFRIVCNEDDARDVVQESFIKMWKNMHRYNPNIKFSTWMYTIVTNSAIDHQRSARKNNLVNIDDFHDKIVHMETANPENKLDNKETGQLINLISGALPVTQKLVFVLRDLQGLSSNEVSAILNLSASSIKSNLYHARKVVGEKLKKILDFERRSV